MKGYYKTIISKTIKFKHLIMKKIQSLNIQVSLIGLSSKTGLFEYEKFKAIPTVKQQQTYGRDPPSDA